jgi:hypothetical protein
MVGRTVEQIERQAERLDRRPEWSDAERELVGLVVDLADELRRQAGEITRLRQLVERGRFPAIPFSGGGWEGSVRS